MIIPDYIQVALDAIEEEDKFALEAEYQLVEWLEEIESGCSLNLINTSKPWSMSMSWSKSLAKSRSGSKSWPRSWSMSMSMSIPWSKSRTMSWSNSS